MPCSAGIWYLLRRRRIRKASIGDIKQIKRIEEDFFDMDKENHLSEKRRNGKNMARRFHAITFRQKDEAK